MSVTVANDVITHQMDAQNTTYDVSSNFDYFHPVYSVTRVSLAFTTLVLIFIVNTFVIIMLIRSKSTRASKNDYYGFYLINICTVDLFIGIVYMPVTVFYQDAVVVSIKTISCCKIMSALHVLNPSIYIATIVMMILERYLILSSRSGKRSSLTRVKFKVFIAWLWAIAISSPQIFFHFYSSTPIYWRCNGLYPTSFYSKSYSFIVIISMFVVPSVIILYSIIGISRSYSSRSALLLKRKKRYQQFISMTLLLLLIFCVCNLPTFLSDILIQYSEDSKFKLILKNVYPFFLLFSCFNYLFSPLVYYIMYRKSLKTDLTASKYQAESRAISDQRRSSSFYRLLPDKQKLSSLSDQRRTSFIARNVLDLRRSSTLSRPECLNDSVIEKLYMTYCHRIGSINEDFNRISVSSSRKSISDPEHSQYFMRRLLRRASRTGESRRYAENSERRLTAESIQHTIHRLQTKQ